MGSDAAIWAGAALLAVLVIGSAVALIRRRGRATVLSREEKLRQARRAADQMGRGRRRTRANRRGRSDYTGGSAVETSSADHGGSSGWDGGGWDGGGSDGGGSGGGGGSD